MKRILAITFALAFAGALLPGCDRNDADRPAGAGDTSTTSQSGKTPTAPGGTQTDQQKRTPQSPAKP
jgi:hypothetical protein